MNMKRSGIYKIINKTNGKYYVGSSIDVNIRFRQHKLRLRKRIHDNPKLQSAYDKHGLDTFDFVLVEMVDVNQLLLIEQKYLDICKLNPQQSYNLNYVAEMPRLGTKHSEKSKHQMSQARMDKTIYRFEHVNSQEIFIGKRFDFYRQYQIHPQNVYDLIKGKNKSVKGWILTNQSNIIQL